MAADRDRWLLPRLASTGGPLGLTMPEPLLRHQLLPNDPVLRGSCFMDELPTSARIVAVEGYPRNSRQCADLVDELRRRCCELVGLVVIDIPDELLLVDVVMRLRSLGAGVSIPPSPNRSSCARRAKPGSERPERASSCG